MFKFMQGFHLLSLKNGKKKRLQIIKLFTYLSWWRSNSGTNIKQLIRVPSMINFWVSIYFYYKFLLKKVINAFFLSAWELVYITFPISLCPMWDYSHSLGYYYECNEAAGYIKYWSEGKKYGWSLHYLMSLKTLSQIRWNTEIFLMKPHKDSWKTYGCTLKSDGSTERIWL